MTTSSVVHCDLCSVGFPVKGRLLAKAKWNVFSHWLTQHTRGSSAEVLLQQRNRLHKTYRSAGPGGAVCDECSKRFQVLGSVAQHCAAEHGLGTPRLEAPKPPLLCDICHKSFLKSFPFHLHQLRRHVGKIIGDRRSLSRSCEDCSKGFPSSHALFCHWLSQHSVKTQAEVHRKLGRKPYAANCDPASRCDDCGRRYGTKEGLVRHKCGGRVSAFFKPKLHKPAFCDFCGRNMMKCWLFKHQARCSKRL